MRRKLIVLALGLVAVVAMSATALAVIPGENPFPAPKVAGVFVSGQTVTGPSSPLGEGVLNSYYPRGGTVVFRAFAGSTKTGQIFTDKDVKYFYVQVPGQPALKLAYEAASKQWPWTATWTVPADFPLGTVQFKILLKSVAKEYGSFVQMPIVSAQLTVTKA